MDTPITADFPAPETAYEAAPRFLHEISWVTRSTADKQFGTPMGREFWLRKAALLNRLALAEGHAPRTDAATSRAAEEAAHHFAQFDHDHHTTQGPRPPEELAAPTFRPYVRAEYLAWQSARSER